MTKPTQLVNSFSSVGVKIKREKKRVRQHCSMIDPGQPMIHRETMSQKPKHKMTKLQVHAEGFVQTAPKAEMGQKPNLKSSSRRNLMNDAFGLWQ